MKTPSPALSETGQRLGASDDVHSSCSRSEQQRRWPVSGKAIAIVDTGGANIGSLVHAFSRLGRRAELTSDAATIRQAAHVILPGVGAASDAMERIRRHDLVGTLRELRQPVLGICLGMQILFDQSEESAAPGAGDTPCLGIVPGRVERFRVTGLTVPHMGWNEATSTGASRLFGPAGETAHYYFVHSYRAAPSATTTAVTQYGERFAAALESQNFFGLQFHPERSGPAGAALLERFLSL